MLPQIHFHPASEFPGWGRYPATICDIIKIANCRKILEIGAGANPTLDEEAVRNLNVQYTITDKEQTGLDRAPKTFATSVMDIESPTLTLQDRFDLVFSRMVLEHVSDGEMAHKNICRILEPGGLAVHCFPTLYALPFVMNALLPPKWSNLCLDLMSSGERHRHDKFPARYSWCRGPTSKMMRKFESVGFEVVEYRGYFGHDYYWKSRLLNRLERMKSNFLARHPIPMMTSYAYIVLKKSPRSSG